MKQKTNRPFSSVVWAVAALAVALGCGASDTGLATGTRRVVELRVSPGGASMFAPFAPQERAAARILAITREVADLRDDDAVAGILLRADTAGLTRSDIQEITTALGSFRQSGKYVLAYALGPGNAGYTLACAADRIVVPPTAVVDLTGLTAGVMFYKELLDKVGVRADFVRAGEYKSAVEPYTRSDMSAPHREMVERLLDDLYRQMTTAIVNGRGFSLDVAGDIIDGGPYTAREALAAGLVDDLAYEDELGELLDSLVGEDVQLTRAPAADSHSGGMTAFMRALQDAAGGRAVRASPNDKIALVHVDGVITTGRAAGFVSSGVASSGLVSRAIREAAEDATVKAIVLRVNSPGGSALASDIIWRAVVEAAKAKPVIASMGSVAASGGYYVAMGADHILADPGTVTGSVGVFGGKLDLGGLYDKIGVRREVVTRGRNANIYGDVGGFTDSERERVRAIIDGIYADFVTKAAQGRGMEFDDMDALARGQVWTGVEAERNGMIDEVGGLRRAFAVAKIHAGYSDDREFELLELPTMPSIWDRLGGDEWSLAAWALGGRHAVRVDAWRALAGERAFALMPFELSFR